MPLLRTSTCRSRHCNGNFRNRRLNELSEASKLIDQLARGRLRGVHRARGRRPPLVIDHWARCEAVLAGHAYGGAWPSKKRMQRTHTTGPSAIFYLADLYVVRASRLR
ncbi:hypothetical protein EVAR_63779_1 [Eumeta japonica]|uniref:Uncharacterized protein n=1 Tax=Eumeta variegata TaxID=151549 RepID=A0A4C1ZK07_EUMVA|nr:hypothetical protein EVAR_63779_1 [Eumeta japonica]